MPDLLPYEMVFVVDTSVHILVVRTELPKTAPPTADPSVEPKVEKTPTGRHIIAVPVRLVSYNLEGRRRLGALVGARVVDLPGLVGHPAFPRTMEALVSRPRGTVLDVARAALERIDELPGWTVRRPRLLAPILPPSFSQEDHRWLAAPGEEIRRPPGNGEARFDLELGAIIFRPKKVRLRASDARGCIFGYTLMHSWFTENSFAASLGPCIVTADDFDAADPVVARVNGKVWSKGILADAHTSFEEQIVSAARTQELLPGEVFGSGSLGRVGEGARPPRSHAIVEIEHPSIGLLRNGVGPKARRKAS